MKGYKRLIIYINNLSKSQVFVAHSFWVIYWNVSCTFVELCMETLYIGVQFWYTNMAAGNQQRHVEFTFSIKALSFHSRASIYVHKHNYLLIFGIVKLLKIKRRYFFWTGQHSSECFGVTTVKMLKFKLLYFRNEICYGTQETCTEIYFLFIFNLV